MGAQHIRGIEARTWYRIDYYQQTYLVIDSFEDLLLQTLETDFAPLYRRLVSVTELGANAVVPDDHVFTLSTQKHANRALS